MDQDLTFDIQSSWLYIGFSEKFRSNVFELRLCKILFVRGSSQKLVQSSLAWSREQERLAFCVSIVGASSLRVSKEKLKFRLSKVEAVLFELAECSSFGSFVEGSDNGTPFHVAAVAGSRNDNGSPRHTTTTAWSRDNGDSPLVRQPPPIIPQEPAMRLKSNDNGGLRNGDLQRNRTRGNDGLQWRIRETSQFMNGGNCRESTGWIASTLLGEEVFPRNGRAKTEFIISYSRTTYRGAETFGNDDPGSFLGRNATRNPKDAAFSGRQLAKEECEKKERRKTMMLSEIIMQCRKREKGEEPQERKRRGGRRDDIRNRNVAKGLREVDDGREGFVGPIDVSFPVREVDDGPPGNQLTSINCTLVDVGSPPQATSMAEEKFVFPPTSLSANQRQLGDVKQRFSLVEGDRGPSVCGEKDFSGNGDWAQAMERENVLHVVVEEWVIEAIPESNLMFN
ncbi:hypothetical protein V8G54_035988 [Vigna mungo]|uniref:Uncharacterized protein n=1 Tax=Vigna mungo TaxID=3915 RepID=A0AAQ3MFY5_VIGMU